LFILLTFYDEIYIYISISNENITHNSVSYVLENLGFSHHFFF